MSSGAPRIRVLVVDDSAFARKVIRLALTTDARIEVVGTASDGLDALEKIEALAPDVVTLDLVMPHLDGLGLLRALGTLKARPRVVLVTISGEDSDVTVEALQLGAVDFVQKPTALASDRLYELSGALIEKVITAASALPQASAPVPSRVAMPPTTGRVKLVVVGTSTGGPQALTQLLTRFPSNFSVPIAVALHIPADYTEALAKRLNEASALEVVEAHHGLRFKGGQAVIAKGGAHLTVQRDEQGLRARVSGQPNTALYFPSVDLLFSSAAAAYGNGVLGVVLTGMGDDGLLGSRAIVAAGGRVVTESESSAVVYGMPRAVKAAGLAVGEARVEDMADEIIRRL